jgi:hypothetical protein
VLEAELGESAAPVRRALVLLVAELNRKGWETGYPIERTGLLRKTYHCEFHSGFEVLFTSENDWSESRGTTVTWFVLLDVQRSRRQRGSR